MLKIFSFGANCQFQTCLQSGQLSVVQSPTKLTNPSFEVLPPPFCGLKIIHPDSEDEDLISSCSRAWGYKGGAQQGDLWNGWMATKRFLASLKVVALSELGFAKYRSLMI